MALRVVNFIQFGVKRIHLNLGYRTSNSIFREAKNS